MGCWGRMAEGSKAGGPTPTRAGEARASAADGAASAVPSLSSVPSPSTLYEVLGGRTQRRVAIDRTPSSVGADAHGDFEWMRLDAFPLAFDDVGSIVLASEDPLLQLNGRRCELALISLVSSHLPASPSSRPISLIPPPSPMAQARRRRRPRWALHHRYQRLPASRLRLARGAARVRAAQPATAGLARPEAHHRGAPPRAQQAAWQPGLKRAGRGVRRGLEPPHPSPRMRLLRCHLLPVATLTGRGPGGLRDSLLHSAPRRSSSPTAGAPSSRGFSRRARAAGAPGPAAAKGRVPRTPRAARAIISTLPRPPSLPWGRSRRRRRRSWRGE